MQKSTNPPATEGSQNSDYGKYRGDEQDWGTGGGPAREQGQDRELARPPREEVLDRTNTFCRPCRIDFGKRRLFLKHHQLVHQRKPRTKSDGRIPTPSPQRRSPSRPITPEPEVSDRSRGRQSGRPEPAAPGQLRGRPATQGRNLGAFRGCVPGASLPPWSKDPTARPPRSLQEEVPRKDKSPSRRRNP